MGRDGYEWMESHYDGLPPEIRKRLQESTYNICAACLRDEFRNLDGLGSREHERIRVWHQALDNIEAAIRAEEAETI